MIDTFPTIDKEQPRLYSMTSGSMASFLYNRIYDVAGEFVGSHNTQIIVGASLVDAPYPERAFIVARRFRPNHHGR